MSFLENDDHSRTILHFDIDCFYAQVEMIMNPSLADKPVGIQQKNIVVTCNYLAREQGVTKCSFIAEAKKSCPALVLVNGEDLANYRKFSQQVFNLLQEVGKVHQCPVERLGLDENFIDVTSIVKERKKSGDYVKNVTGHVYGEKRSDCSCDCDCDENMVVGSILAAEIRKRIFETVGLTTSCGVSHNKLLAKLAGAIHKPNQQTTMFPCNGAEFISSLASARAIPGIGSSTFKILESKGLSSIGSIRESSVEFLSTFLDFSVAQRIKQLSLGVDANAVKASGLALSIGLEDRFKVINTKQDCYDKLAWLLGRLTKLLIDDGRQPQTLKISVRDSLKDKGSFHKESRQVKISPSLFNGLRNSEKLSSDSETTLLNTCMSLLSKMIDFANPFHVTLLGISVTDFVTSHKNGIQSYFGGKMAPKCSTQSVKSAEEKSKFSPNSSSHELVGTKLTSSEHLKNESTQPQKFPSFSSETSCGTKRNSEHLENESTSEPQNLPTGWDAEVFKSLPRELQQELLASSSSQTTPTSQVKKKPKNSANSILNYFGKN